MYHSFILTIYFSLQICYNTEVTRASRAANRGKIVSNLTSEEHNETDEDDDDDDDVDMVDPRSQSSTTKNSRKSKIDASTTSSSNKKNTLRGTSASRHNSHSVLDDDDDDDDSSDDDDAYWTKNKPSGLTKAKTSDTAIENNNKKRKSNSLKSTPLAGTSRAGNISLLHGSSKNGNKATTSVVGKQRPPSSSALADCAANRLKTVLPSSAIPTISNKTSEKENDTDTEDDESEEEEKTDTQSSHYWTEVEDTAVLKKRSILGKTWAKIALEIGRPIWGCKNRYQKLTENCVDNEDIDEIVRRFRSNNPNRPNRHHPYAIWKEEELKILIEQQKIHRNDWETISSLIPRKTAEGCRKRYKRLTTESLETYSDRTRVYKPTVIEPTVASPLDELANVPMYSTIQKYLETPDLYAAVLSPATIKLIVKNDYLLYSQDLPLRRSLAVSILATIRQVKTLIEPITTIDNAKVNGVHIYFGTTCQNDVRDRCGNFLIPTSKTVNEVVVVDTPKLINVSTKQNLTPQDATKFCYMKNYVLMASAYKQCVLHVEDHCIREYQDRDDHICLNHGTSPICYTSLPPSKKELENPVIYRLYLTVLRTKQAIEDDVVIVGSSPEAQSYLPIQKCNYKSKSRPSRAEQQQNKAE